MLSNYKESQDEIFFFLLLMIHNFKINKTKIANDFKVNEFDN